MPEPRDTDEVEGKDLWSEIMGKEVQNTDVVKGFVDDVTDMVGIHRIDEFIPTPRDLAHAIGLPTLKEAVPSPKDVGDAVTSKRGLPRPPMPPTPAELAARMG